MSESKTCGTCIRCVKHEGPPYYCAARDLYYFVTPNDKACADYVPDAAEVKQEEKPVKDWPPYLDLPRGGSE